MQHLLVKYVIITNEENKNIQKCIRASASGIAECLDRHDLSKRRVKKVNKCDNPFFQHRLRAWRKCTKNHFADGERIEKNESHIMICYLIFRSFNPIYGNRSHHISGKALLAVILPPIQTNGYRKPGQTDYSTGHLRTI